MQYSTLKRSGAEVSRLCFGAMRFVPKDSDESGWGEGERALNEAIDAGVNVIHSNSSWPTYPALSAMLEKHPRRSELHHVIKVESPDYEEGHFDPQVFRQQVEAGLRELHTERITVVQHLQRGPHCPKTMAYSQAGDARRLAALSEISEQMAQVEQEMVQAGKVGEVATFPHTAGFAAEAIKTGVYGSVVHFFSMLETEMVPLLDELQERDISFIGLRPLVQGLLTDARVDRASVPADDSKHEQRYDEWYDRLAAVREKVGEPADSWNSLALRFGWAHPAVTSLAVGMNSAAQVQQAVAAIEADPVDVATVREVSELVKSLPSISKDTLFG